MLRVPIVPPKLTWSAASLLCTLCLAGCSGSTDPYEYVKVSGTVTYDDGSRIDTQSLDLHFIPQTKPATSKLYPRVGLCVVDAATGKFDRVTSHKPNDGLVRGKHKVTVSGGDNSLLPASIVPEIYHDPEKTPLEVDTEHLPFEIKIKKP